MVIGVSFRSQKHEVIVHFIFNTDMNKQNYFAWGLIHATQGYFYSLKIGADKCEVDILNLLQYLKYTWEYMIRHFSVVNYSDI